MNRFFILQVCFLFVSLRLSGQCHVEVSLGDPHDAVCYGTATGSIVAQAAGGTKPYTFLLNGTEIVPDQDVIHYLAAGDYKLIVTDANNCSSPDVNFTIKEPPTIKAKVDITDATCGLTNGAVVITPEPGADAYDYRWSDNLPHGSSPHDLAPGNYTVTIYYNRNERCEHLENVTIVNKGGVKAKIGNSTNVTCFGVNDGSATVHVQGTGPYTYLWSPSGGNAATANNLHAGTYSVVVTDDVGCTDNASVVISQPEEIHTTISKHDATCGNSNGDASVTVTAPTGSYTYFWTPGNFSTQNVSGLAAGTYTVTVTNERGCSKTQQVIIDRGPVPEITTFEHTDVLCNGQQNGSAAAIVVNGLKPYSFSWSGGINTFTDSAIRHLAVGTYTLTVTDANRCSATGSVSITQPEPLVHNITFSPVTCTAGGAATVSETGGTAPYNYLWKPGDQTTASVSGLAAGDYEVYIYDKNHCEDKETIKIASSGKLTVSIGDITNVTCNEGGNGSATAYAAGIAPYTYTWSPAGGTGQTAANLGAGKYTVSVTDQQGCTATATTQITEPPLITTQITAVPAACGNSNGSARVVANGGTGNYTFNWQPGNFTGDEMKNVTAGTYTVTVKDANGCVKTDEVIIKGSSPVAISGIVPSDVKCNGEQTGSATATVIGGTGSYTYKWVNGGDNYSGNPLLNVGAGNYQLTVTDAEGCSASGSVTINQPLPLGHAVKINSATCRNSNGSAAITENGGTRPYTYAWLPSGGEGPSATGLAAGDYKSYITDANGCTDSAHVHIVNLGGVLATITNTRDVTCYGGSNGSATVSAEGVATPFTFAWSSGAGTAATASNLFAGDYNVTVTDHEGCVATASTSVRQPTALQTKVADRNTTCNNSNGSASVVATGGVGPYTYAWTPGNYQTSTISNLAAGSYKVIVSDSHDCSTVDSAVIAPSSKPVIDTIIRTDVTCYGKQDGTALAKVSKGIAPYRFAWTNGTASFTSERIQNLMTGNYQLKVTDVAGCTATGSTTIAEPAELQLSVAAAHTTCGSNNGSAVLNVWGGITPYRYEWSNGSREKSISNIPAGAYHVKCIDSNNCIAVANDVKINSSVPLKVSLGKDTSICPGNEVILNPGTFKSYTWHDNSHNQIFKAVQAGVYAVTVTDSIGCSASASIKVDIICNDIVFPDAFTPNGDGHNDTFGPLGTLSAIKDYTLTIYNRWGQPIFSTYNPYKKWDGKFNSSDVGSGTFVWIATYSFNGQPKKVQKGTIIVIK